MKKSKIYFIAPIVALAVFGAYYWQFSSEYDAKQAAIVAAEKARKADKLMQEAKAREKAILDANAAAVQRKKERAEREAHERQMKEDEENAKLGAEKADQESQKLLHQVDKLAAEVKLAQEDIKKLTGEQAGANEELVFLKQYLTEAQANQAKLQEVVLKIDKADKALARALLTASIDAAAKK